MNEPQFNDVFAAIQSKWFRFPIADAGRAGYFVDLRDLEHQKVRAAIDVLAAEGIQEAPTAGQIRRKVAELELDAPSWADARSALLEWRRNRPNRQAVAEAWKCPHGTCDGDGFVHDEETNTASDCECRPAYLEAVRGVDALAPLLREFVNERHVNPGEVDALLEGGNTQLEAQVRQRWGQFIDRAIQSRALAGLPGTAGLARLEAARAEDEQRPERVVEKETSGPRRLDAAAALQLEAPR